MKTIGLLGGMSWESTATYYRLINQQTRLRLGGLHSAELVLWSFDFSQIELLLAHGEWEEAGNLLKQAALKLEGAGADCIVICANTMHKVASYIQDGLTIPFIHIAETTANAIQKVKRRKPLLLATRYIMEQDFYIRRLQDNYGLSVVIPDNGGQAVVHDIAYNELCRGQINEDSRRTLLQIVRKAQDQGADSVILGCTELGLLVGQEDISAPVVDSTTEHVRGILDFALKNESEFEELV
ncbi:putative amino-acid racemase [Pseudovibrio sp. W64]|uniref:aspartate/glutamate racemase family protein n=1 Tax=unclassified Pseudovibrio TaxID=2627060 RepID=UPI0007AEAE27|nr:MULTISPECIES: aspartate/glutamate racemase family protein [unclassified Pseudovibrio]KZK77880.1 putative amino-acid racemase [Pseudovibrio sp. W64]KZK95758.1 putative amino-acid racemase [Pseudovibrio sp. Ad46]KZL00228.1 putative amino-acid racemase [Pseudovibrio sp. W74]KZL11626.1 putative amino-acid racemase [Pseudovibrio sp. Ad14]KZL16084.1 putative amino-acid racemase [Pseudovibrio sp. Ad26]